MSEPAIDKALSALHRLLADRELAECCIRVRVDGRVSITFSNQHVRHAMDADVAQDAAGEAFPNERLSAAFGCAWEAP